MYGQWPCNPECDQLGINFFVFSATPSSLSPTIFQPEFYFLFFYCIIFYNNNNKQQKLQFHFFMIFFFNFFPQYYFVWSNLLLFHGLNVFQILFLSITLSTFRVANFPSHTQIMSSLTFYITILII